MISLSVLNQFWYSIWWWSVGCGYQLFCLKKNHSCFKGLWIRFVTFVFGSKPKPDMPSGNSNIKPLPLCDSNQPLVASSVFTAWSSLWACTVYQPNNHTQSSSIHGGNVQLISDLSEDVVTFLPLCVRVLQVCLFMCRARWSEREKALWHSRHS